jgi:GNAT superfamily N-acetyltransferase
MIQVNQAVKINNTADVVYEKSPSFSGIVNQDCKGNLWVDNMDAPDIAIAESYAVGGFAFLGNGKSTKVFLDLKEFLENELFDRLTKDGCECFEFSIESDNKSFRKNILELFQDKTIHTEKEFSFRANSIPDNNTSIPNEYHIRKVDHAFWKMLSDGEYENEDLIRIRLLESWYSFEDFVNKSIAYCTVLGNRIVAVMLGTASFNHVIAIDIETEEEHRKKGLAYAMAAEFITDCLKNNYTPQWDCVESNPASYHLARKLGFEEIRENTVYSFSL